MKKQASVKATIRCAIYTRKSTEEGLDQDFNTLDAQRESSEAYISSQQHEGWVCLPDRYDDGGYTGGNMERPALKRLLADIEAGKVDMVVTYKVDRLSRSLMDFAKMMETFEKHGVSFVSITQQINSATSMGRLILNVLLSFAQFERELISERTRDKIAAARRKGKWSGGKPILGYDVDDRTRLVVNKDEARRVVAIFKLYLEHQALIPTIRELNQRGWRTKTWITKKNTQVGGQPFDKMKLHRLLTNVTYIGKVSHHGQIYDGEHPGIVPEDLFSRVQAVLDRNRQTGGSATRNRYGALLRGLLRCVPCQCSMGHTYSCKNGRTKYRYYVCLSAQKRGWDACPSKSVPAADIERFVLDRIRTIGQDLSLLAETLRQARKQGDERIAELDAEARAVERELARLGKQVARDGDFHERLQTAERRQTQIREEKIALERELVEERDVATAFAAFDPMWEAMTLMEQCRLVQLLVERVDYDGAHGKVTVTFHPSGIKTLAGEAAAKGA